MKTKFFTIILLLSIFPAIVSEASLSYKVRRDTVIKCSITLLPDAQNLFEKIYTQMAKDAYTPVSFFYDITQHISFNLPVIPHTFMQCNTEYVHVHGDDEGHSHTEEEIHVKYPKWLRWIKTYLSKLSQSFILNLFLFVIYIPSLFRN